MVDFNALSKMVVELYRSDGKLDDADALLIEEKFNLDTFGHEGATQICEGVNTEGELSSADNLSEFSADDRKNLISFIGSKPRDARKEHLARLSAESGVSCDSFTLFFRLDDPNIPGEYQYEFRELAKKGGNADEVDACDLSLLAKDAFVIDSQKQSFTNKANYMKTVEVPGAWPWSDPIKEKVFDYKKFYQQLLVAKYGLNFPTLTTTAVSEGKTTEALVQEYFGNTNWELPKGMEASVGLANAIGSLQAEYGSRAFANSDTMFMGIRDYSPIFAYYGVLPVSSYKAIICFPKKHVYFVIEVDDQWRIKVEGYDEYGNSLWYLRADCSALLKKDTNPVGVEEYIYRHLKDLNKEAQERELKNITIPVTTNLTREQWDFLTESLDEDAKPFLFPLFVQYLGLYPKIFYNLPPQY